MGMINTDILPIGSVDARQSNIDHSMVENIASETIIVNATELSKSAQGCDCRMQSNSIASSRTSTTDPLEDVGEGEEGENRAIVAAVESISEKSEEVPEAPLFESKIVPEAPLVESISRRHTVASCESTSTSGKKFGFSTITIREYGRELGDNVTVMGPPIGLSWEHQDEIVYDLLEYDEAVLGTRRTQSELKMPSKHRDQILRDGGYSRLEIQEAIKRSNIARSQRKRTVETLKLQPLQEAFEKVVRVGKKPLRKKEKDLLKMDMRKSI